MEAQLKLNRDLIHMRVSMVSMYNLTITEKDKTAEMIWGKGGLIEISIRDYEGAFSMTMDGHSMMSDNLVEKPKLLLYPLSTCTFAGLPIKTRGNNADYKAEYILIVLYRNYYKNLEGSRFFIINIEK